MGTIRENRQGENSQRNYDPFHLSSSSQFRRPARFHTPLRSFFLFVLTIHSITNFRVPLTPAIAFSFLLQLRLVRYAFSIPFACTSFFLQIVTRFSVAFAEKISTAYQQIVTAATRYPDVKQF